MRRTSLAVASLVQTFGLFLGVEAGFVSGQALPPATAADPQPCVVLNGSQGPQPRQAEPRVSQAQPASELEPVDARRKPMNEREVLQLIETLEAAQGQKAGGPSKVERSSADRLRVVLDDATALLVVMHVQEDAKRFETDRHRRSEAVQWVEGRFAGIQTCVSGRFDDRGGEPAYRQSLALVEKHRAKLEPLVLGLGRWVPAEPSSGWEKTR